VTLSCVTEMQYMISKVSPFPLNSKTKNNQFLTATDCSYVDQGLSTHCVLNSLNAKSVDRTCIRSSFILNLDANSCTTIFLLLNRHVATCCVPLAVSATPDGMQLYFMHFVLYVFVTLLIHYQ